MVESISTSSLICNVDTMDFSLSNYVEKLKHKTNHIGQYYWKYALYSVVIHVYLGSITININ